MKGLYTVLLTGLMLLCFNDLSAQTMSVKSFDAVINDMDARVNFPRTDPNGRKAALIKIETTEKGFAFDVGQLGVVDIVENKVAEVWVYIPQGAIRIEIMHQQLGKIYYEFPMAIEEATVYDMKLTTAKIHTVYEEDDGGQFFILRTTPSEVEVKIDDEAPISISTGSINKFLTYGEHTYSVSAPLYATVEGSVTIANERVDKSIELVPSFGFLNVDSEPVAGVEINGLSVGDTPYRSPRLALGNYEVVLSAPNCDPISRSVALVEPEATVTVSESLVSFLSMISVKAGMEGASIYINGEYKGVDSWSGELLPGDYIVSSSMNTSYRDSRRKISVQKATPQSISLDAPRPMYGKFRVNSNTIDVVVSVDGKEVGTAPDTFDNLLVGSHNVTYSKEGQPDKSEIITIEEGKITDANVNFDIVETPAVSNKSAVPAPAPAPAPAPTPRPATSPAVIPSEQEDVTPKTAESSDSDRWKDENLEDMPMFSDPGFMDEEVAEIERSKAASKATPTTPATPTPPASKKVSTRSTFLIYQTPFLAKEGSMGGMFAIAGRSGVYGKFVSNFASQSKFDYERNYADCTHLELDVPAPDVYYYNEDYNAHLAVTAGYVQRLGGSFYLYAGAGYGSRSLIWRTGTDEYVKITDYSYKGIATDVGAMLKLKWFVLSAGVSSIDFKYSDINLGVGFAF